jgi:hypothetical protein
VSVCKNSPTSVRASTLRDAPCEVAHGDDANERPALHHREMPESAVEHPVHRLTYRGGRPDSQRIPGHAFRHGGDSGGIGVHLIERSEDVPLGEDAHQRAVLQHEDRPTRAFDMALTASIIIVDGSTVTRSVLMTSRTVVIESPPGRLLQSS